jgi:hypothetical protein
VPVNESLFPDLARTGYQVTSPPDPIYNCIAWAAGRTDQWWWPDPGGFEFWPPGVPRMATLAAFAQAFATLGYTACPDPALEAGWEKVAIFTLNDDPTHAARQLSTGRWTSKLGPDDDIEHELEGLVGPAYGTVAIILRRPRS